MTMFNNKFKKKKKEKRLRRLGFTLVEILVVMAIIAMLSTMAVGGYMSYRRSALLGLGADNLVSQIDAMRAKAVYGTSTDQKFQDIKKQLASKTTSPASSSNNNTAQCYGVLFENNAGNFNVSSFVVKFVNTKWWNPDPKHQAWEYKGCMDLQTADVKQKLEMDPQMHVFDISGVNNDDTKYSPATNLVLLLRFLPPNGKLEVLDVTDLSHPKVLTDLKILKFSVRYGQDSDPNYQKEITLDLTTNKFTVNKMTTPNAK